MLALRLLLLSCLALLQMQQPAQAARYRLFKRLKAGSRGAKGGLAAGIASVRARRSARRNMEAHKETAAIASVEGQVAAQRKAHGLQVADTAKIRATDEVVRIFEIDMKSDRPYKVMNVKGRLMNKAEAELELVEKADTPQAQQDTATAATVEGQSVAQRQAQKDTATEATAEGQPSSQRQASPAARPSPTQRRKTTGIAEADEPSSAAQQKAKPSSISNGGPKEAQKGAKATHSQTGRPRVRELLLELPSFKQKEEAQCFEGEGEGRVGCADGCPCRWFERCYPKYVLWQGSSGQKEELESIDIGSCNLSLTMLVVLSVALFCALVALVFAVRGALFILAFMSDKTKMDLMKQKNRPIRISSSYPVTDDLIPHEPHRDEHSAA